MTITGRNPRLIIIDESNHYISVGESRAMIERMLAAIRDSEARTILIDSVPPRAGKCVSADYSTLELRLLAHTEPPKWMFEQAPDPRKKPKGPRNRWGGLKS